MKITILSSVLYLFIIQCNVETARILSVLPLPLPSHFIILKPILEGLAKEGHEIDVVAPYDKISNVHGINLIRVEMPNLFRKFFDYSIEDFRKLSTESVIRMMFVDHVNLCEVLLKPKQMVDLRSSKKKYDLIILEQFVADCLYGFAHTFQAPVVTVTTSEDMPWGTNRLGNPFNTAHMSHYYGIYASPMTLSERFYNTALFLRAKLMHKWYQRQQELVAKEFFGHDMPSLNALVANTSLFLLNTHFSLNQIRPNLPNVVEVAGLHIDEPQHLDKQFSDFLGDSKFVIFSLGSIAKTISLKRHIIEAIFEELNRRNIKVIWKIGKGVEVPKDLNIPKNVLTISWIPRQLDILCHSSIVFFITHNGLSSTQEAVHCGVPMLSIPVFADQFHNAETMVKKGVAIKLEIETVSKEDVVNIIEELIENPSYRNNVKMLSQQFKDRPRKPLNEALFWVNYILRYKGASHFKSPAINLAWYEYYLVDIVFLLFSSITLLALITYFIIKVIKNVIVGKETTKQKSS